jgi:Rieske 2Fe-2S family protein
VTVRLHLVSEGDAVVPSTGDLRACPLGAEDVEGTLRPLEEATTLPRRAYVDAEVFAFEHERWFCSDWLCVGRTSDVESIGRWYLASLGRESVIIVKGDDGVVRAFHNVCRHRGVTLLESCVEADRIRCPYHAWAYDSCGKLVRAPRMRGVIGFDPADHGLIPVRLEIFGGFLFVSLASEGPSLLAWLDDLPGQFEDIRLDRLVVGRRSETVVRANWKLLMENFAESYHFGPVHPELQSLTPSDRAESLLSTGPWQGGWMPLRAGAETVSQDGRGHGRPLLRSTGVEMRGALDYVLFPNLFLSLHPDYLLAYRLLPSAHDETRVSFEVLFDPEAAKDGAVDAPDIYDFWNTTNAQDFAICERQQSGISSLGSLPGRYAPAEEGTHEFDKIVAQRYAER